MLKSCASTFSILISHLANLSFDQGAFPSKFKHALITPLLKKPGLSKSDTSNFRPISNLNTIGKILERLALARLLPHLSVSPSFSPGPLQSAYRKFHSTETALLKLTNDIMDAIDSGKVTILAALDMSAAFDTLNHTTLFHRLENTFGLSRTVHTWIHSYLTNRSSFVRIDSSSSSCDTSLTGVPQGSVLGPLFFVLFISPVVDVIGLIPDTQNRSEMVSFHQHSPIDWFFPGIYQASSISELAAQFLSVQQQRDSETDRCFKDKVICPGSYTDRRVEGVPGRASSNYHSHVQPIAAGGPTSTVSAARHHHTNRQKAGFGLRRRQKLPTNIKFDLHVEICRAIGLQAGHVFPGRK